MDLWYRKCYHHLFVVKWTPFFLPLFILQEKYRIGLGLGLHVMTYHMWWHTFEYFFMCGPNPLLFKRDTCDMWWCWLLAEWAGILSDSRLLLLDSFDSSGFGLLKVFSNWMYYANNKMTLLKEQLFSSFIIIIIYSHTTYV